MISGPADRPFDFSWHTRRLCVDIVKRCPELAHIDVSRLLIGMTQARSGRSWGLQARLTPLRFHGGELRRRIRGVTYQVQRYFVDRREMLYLLTFCLPRFLDQVFQEKLITLFHELYHISPVFNGDIRRHPGRYGIHSYSKQEYDRSMACLVRQYLDTDPDPDLFDFLRLGYGQLRQRHGSVVGMVVPRPRSIPIIGPSGPRFEVQETV